MNAATGPPADDDAFWRRPDPGSPAGPAAPGSPAAPGGPDAGALSHPEPPTYTGPPPTVAPPPGWRPPTVNPPPPPRALPAQDLAALDEAERSARTLTYGIGMVAGALMLVLLCLLCSRVLF